MWHGGQHAEDGASANFPTKKAASSKKAPVWVLEILQLDLGHCKALPAPAEIWVACAREGIGEGLEGRLPRKIGSYVCPPDSPPIAGRGGIPFLPLVAETARTLFQTHFLGFSISCHGSLSMKSPAKWHFTPRFDKMDGHVCVFLP